MWIVSGSITIGAAFGIAELLYKPLQYYIHERIWYRYIRYGIIKTDEKDSITTENNSEPIKRIKYTKKTT